MSKVKFGLIGYGNIGKRHAVHIQQHPEAELVGICEVLGFDFSSKEFSGIEMFTDMSSFLRNTNSDVINVCTPNYLHHPHTIASLQHGKHVVCEKPMAISAQQCEEMILAAEKYDKTIFVVKQNRYNEPVQQVKKLIQDNGLGKIFMVNVNCFWNRNEGYYQQSSWRGKKLEDGGCLFTQFSHFVDILYYLFGDVIASQGKMFNYNHAYTEVEDTGSFVLEMTSGALVNFNFSTCSFEKNMEGAFTILGEKGTVKIGGQYLNTIEYQHIANGQLPAIAIEAKANDYGTYQGSMSNHDKVIDNVVQTLHGKSTVMTNAYEGKKVVEIIEKMYGSVKG
jgi:UDP-N-acetyl-2-amino-2-deoxyglucuronate dehydrogenase